MVRALWTCRPARIDECVVYKLLNVVNHPLLKIRRIVREHSNAADRFDYHRLMVAANGL